MFKWSMAAVQLSFNREFGSHIFTIVNIKWRPATTVTTTFDATLWLTGVAVPSKY